MADEKKSSDRTLRGAIERATTMAVLGPGPGPSSGDKEVMRASVKAAADKAKEKKSGSGGEDTVLRRAKGGKVPGKGSKDTVRAKLTPGEFVVRKGAAAGNMPVLRQMNRMGPTRVRRD